MSIKLISGLLLILSYSICLSQNRWHPFLGVHASMNADAYYVGLSIQFGTDLLLKNKLSLSPYFHYFSNKVKAYYSDGSFENGSYQSASVAILLNRHLGKKERQGIFLGGGLALQKRVEDFYSNIADSISENKTMLVLAIRLGYSFILRKKCLTIEINTLGPHKTVFSKDPYSSQTDYLTQLSLGSRIIF